MFMLNVTLCCHSVVSVTAAEGLFGADCVWLVACWLVLPLVRGWLVGIYSGWWLVGWDWHWLVAGWLGLTTGCWHTARRVPGNYAAPTYNATNPQELCGANIQRHQSPGTTRRLHTAPPIPRNYAAPTYSATNHQELLGAYIQRHKSP